MLFQGPFQTCVLNLCVYAPEPCLYAYSNRVRNTACEQSVLTYLLNICTIFMMEQRHKL